MFVGVCGCVRASVRGCVCVCATCRVQAGTVFGVAPGRPERSRCPSIGQHSPSLSPPSPLSLLCPGMAQSLSVPLPACVSVVP